MPHGYLGLIDVGPASFEHRDFIFQSIVFGEYLLKRNAFVCEVILSVGFLGFRLVYHGAESAEVTRELFRVRRGL